MSTIYVLGSLNVDYVVGVERLAIAGETLSGGNLSVYPGGKGGNQAVAAARLGGNVRMIAQVGSDDQGVFLLNSLQQAGVNTEAVRKVEGASGAALIQVLPDGDNAIVISPGANVLVDRQLVRKQLQDLQAGDFLLCQLEVPLEAVEEACSIAHERSAVSILDPTPARQLPSSLTSKVQILTPNETETAVLLDQQEFKGPKALNKLRSLGSASVAVKMGSLGAWISNNEEIYHIPAFPVKAIDTTAAGDTYNAALAVGLSEGMEFRDAAHWAAAAAAISVTRVGAQTSCPSRTEVQKFLSTRAV